MTAKSSTYASALFKTAKTTVTAMATGAAAALFLNAAVGISNPTHAKAGYCNKQNNYCNGWVRNRYGRPHDLRSQGQARRNYFRCNMEVEKRCNPNRLRRFGPLGFDLTASAQNKFG